MATKPVVEMRYAGLGGPAADQVRARYKQRGWTDAELTDGKVQQIIARERTSDKERRKLDRMADRETAAASDALSAQLMSPEVQQQAKAERRKHFHAFRQNLAARRLGGDVDQRQQRAQSVALAAGRVQAPEAVQRVLKSHQALVEGQLEGKDNYTMVQCKPCDKKLVPFDQFKWCECKLKKYCCKEAQQFDWPTHKAACKEARGVCKKATEAATLALAVAAPAPDRAAAMSPDMETYVRAQIAQHMANSITRSVGGAYSIRMGLTEVRSQLSVESQATLDAQLAIINDSYEKLVTALQTIAAGGEPGDEALEASDRLAATIDVIKAIPDLPAETIPPSPEVGAQRAVLASAELTRRVGVPIIFQTVPAPHRQVVL